MKHKIEFTQTEAKRPLIHIPNRPDIFIYPDSEVFVGSMGLGFGDTKYFYIDDERTFPASNSIDYCEYGLIPEEDRLQWITDMMNGEHMTPLEIDKRNDKIIAEHLPKRDLVTAKYQFSNQVRPTNEWIYKDGQYYKVWAGKVCDQPYEPLDLAWSMNRNVMVVLPENITECDSSLFEKLHSEKKNLIEANK